jgi:GT2 family glycosyltransferase
MNSLSPHSAVVNLPVPGMVSIILLNWNGKEFLQECLRSVHTQSYPHVELLIIDNCSTDGSQDVLLRDYSQYPLFLNETNLGYCGGANLGIRHAKGEYILLLNPDVILHDDFLRGLVEVAERDDTLGILTGKLLRFDQQTLDSTGQFLRSDLSPLERGYNERDTGKYDQPQAVFSTCGAVAFYRRTMLEDIQLEGEYFDESYFAFYEDLDIGWRAQLAGWRAYYVPDAVAYHYRGGGLKEQEQQKCWFEYFPFLSRGSLFNKPVFIQRHVILNRYLTILKNASWRDMLLGCPAIFKYEVLLWGYVLCMRPSLLTVLVDLVKLLPATIKKRRSIQSRKVASSAYLRKQIRNTS